MKWERFQPVLVAIVLNYCKQDHINAADVYYNL